MIQLKDLTLREKICQTVILNNPYNEFEKYGGYEKLLKKYPVGGLYFGGAIVGGPMDGVKEVFENRDEWNKLLKVPYIACCDSPSSGIPEINAMTVGACDNEEFAYRLGAEYAKLCRKKNMHWIFMPVCDLDLEALAPISIRSYGDNPEKVIKFSNAFIKGVEKYNVIATAKHFPGMGHEIIDTHIAPVITKMPKEEWDNTYRKIYSSLIDNGLRSVMTAHISLPCYQNDVDENGHYPQATRSKDLISGLLKKDLGFGGVTVTDGLIMGGAGDSCQFAIDAFLAGNDMLLWPPLEYVDVLEQKILSGEISEDRLDDAVTRILKAKEFAFSECRECDTEYKMPELAREIANGSIALINNRLGLLPLKKESVKKVLLVASHPSEFVSKGLKQLKSIFEERGIEVFLEENIWTPKLREYEKECDLTVFAFYEGASNVAGSIALYGDWSINVWAAQTADPKKTVIASFGTPYLYKQYFSYGDTYVNAYNYSEESLRAFVSALFGEIPFDGTCTVDLSR